MKNLKVSLLAKTWFFDLDGTILRHNSLWQEGHDEVLPGVLEFWATIPAQDKIVITTARDEIEKERTLKFLDEQGIRYDHTIFGLPYGERFLLNDLKPNGLKTAVAINLERNIGLKNLNIIEDPTLFEILPGHY